jgi:hypothetical protein
VKRFVITHSSEINTTGEKSVMQTENMKSFATAIAMTLGMLIGAAPIASAQSTQCIGSIADGRTIDGNLIVPLNATCELDNVTVGGNVKVGTALPFKPSPSRDRRSQSTATLRRWVWSC